MHLRRAAAVASLALVGLLGVARPAFADEPAPPTLPPAPPAPLPLAPAPPPAPAPPAAHRDGSYAAQTLAVDLGALAIAGTGVGTGSLPVMIAGYTTFLVGPPVIHAAHGHADRTALDFTIRALAPVLGGYIGSAIQKSTAGPCMNVESGCSWDFLTGAADGALVGYVAAVVFDLALLTREPATTASEPPPPKPAPTATAAVRWSPTLAVTPQGGSLGLVGAF